MLTKSLICVTGLPHAGSTVLCQLLGQHAQLYSPGSPSPLCPMLLELRQSLSANPILQSQINQSQINLDSATVHRRLLAAFQGWINGWFAEVEQEWVIDPHGDWLRHLELLQLLDPNCRVLVCVRELGQIWGAIESQHQKTLLFDLPDQLAKLTPIERADRLFAREGEIGKSIRSLEAVQDRSAALQSRLYYVVYEHLMSDPKDAIQGIYEWLELPLAKPDLQLLDSAPLELHPPYPVPPRITASLQQNFRWFYEMFYPGVLEA
ncbi:MAG TPA: sulfotransferase [Allocoleopsis sp.]